MQISDAVFKTTLGVLDVNWFDDHVAVKIAEHPFGSGLGHIDTHNAEVFWLDALHARVEDTIGLLKNHSLASLGP